MKLGDLYGICYVKKKIIRTWFEQAKWS